MNNSAIVIAMITSIAAVITALAYAVIAFMTMFAVRGELKRNRLEREKIRKEDEQRRKDEQRAQQDEQRAQQNLAIEKRRLAEANVLVGDELSLTHTPNNRPFVVFRTPINNIGDGPIDIWAALTSARILSDTYRPGVGLQSRDVTWDDYERFFWNIDRGESNSLFAGISTTKNMVASPSHFLRFVAKEHGALRRIDAVNNPVLLQTQQPIYLMYRVFLVLRGYPLGEILRQLGGKEPNYASNVREEELQFRSLGQPNYARWKNVQEAIANLNRLVFRLASDESDPLGEIVEQDAWRYFLLDHENFIGDQATVNGRNMTIDVLSKYVTETYFDGSLPINVIADKNFQAAQDFCRLQLRPMIDKWNALKKIIRESQEYIPASTDDYPDGYSSVIHTNSEYQRKWLQYLKEAYLLSRPAPRKGNPGDLDQDDIPPDPRVLEPFVMRTYFFLKTLVV